MQSILDRLKSALSHVQLIRNNLMHKDKISNEQGRETAGKLHFKRLLDISRIHGN